MPRRSHRSGPVASAQSPVKWPVRASSAATGPTQACRPGRRARNVHRLAQGNRSNAVEHCSLEPSLTGQTPGIRARRRRRRGGSAWSGSVPAKLPRQARDHWRLPTGAVRQRSAKRARRGTNGSPRPSTLRGSRGRRKGRASWRAGPCRTRIARSAPGCRSYAESSKGRVAGRSTASRRCSRGAERGSVTDAPDAARGCGLAGEAGAQMRRTHLPRALRCVV